MKNKNIIYFITYNDDNHEPVCWLNTQHIGWISYCDMGSTIEKIIDYAIKNNLKDYELKSIELYIDNIGEGLEEEKQENLFDYFQTIPNFDNEDIKLLSKIDNSKTKEESKEYWQHFYNKNIKKINRKIGV